MNANDKWDDWNRCRSPKYPHEKLIQFVFRAFPGGRENIRILDLGCGSGANTVFLVREGFNVAATDISQVAVDMTLEKLEGLTADVRQGTVDRIDFGSNTFDCVVSISVLECAGLPYFLKAISEVLRVLKPGGTAFLLFASDDDFRVNGSNELGLHGFTDEEVGAARASVVGETEFFWMDRYVTTYNNRAIQGNDHLLTIRKKQG